LSPNLDPIGELQAYEQAALAAIAVAGDAASLEAVRIEFLGRKHGRLRELQSLLGQVEPAQRPVVGKQFNDAKSKVESAFEARKQDLARPKSVASGIDVTLPGTPFNLGRKHPLTQTMDDLKEIVGRFGFSVVDGPELEDEWHNFEALNIPEAHPARDPLDNFYVATAAVGAPGEAKSSEATSSEHRAAVLLRSQTSTEATSSEHRAAVLLRSQTSTVQIRVMEGRKPPVRIVCLGRVYRPDTIDATHSCMFHQMEGLMVGRGVTMAQLKTVIRMLFSAYLEHDVSIRFRPSFFPFTEPSVEVDIPWERRWMEIGGAGMVDPHVLESVGYDSEEVTGFAFGLGIERLCMKRHGITDIRRFYENDLRFLRQF
jgi:phenylalanyl-tRNA synthetase alpha chain